MEAKPAPQWINVYGLKGQMALSAAAGAMASLGLAPFHLWPLALLGLTALFWLAPTAPSRKAAALMGWAAGAGYFSVALVWIVEPFFVEPWRHGWMAPFALSFMAGGLALFWALAFALAHHRGALALIASLAGAELARSYLFTGFPWALIGHLWLPSPVALRAADVGAHGLTLLALGTAAAFAQRLKGRSLSAYAALAAVLVVLGPSFIDGHGARPAPDESQPLIRLIQPNAAQHEKWDRELIPMFFERQLEYTAAPRPDGARPDLIVWPETAIPWLLSRAEEPLSIISAAAGGAPVVVGAQRLEGEALYNSLVVLGADGTPQEIYDKHHLVPFGEYIPLGTWLSGLGLKGLAAQDGNGYAAGPGLRHINLGAKLGSFLPLICYEAIFPNHILDEGAWGGSFIQITNDAWFGKFSGPQQHFDLARLRAIEFGRPLLRAANTGISAVIGPRGHVIASLELGEAGYVDARLPSQALPTSYSHLGDTPAIIAIFLLFAFSMLILPLISRAKAKSS